MAFVFFTLFDFHFFHFSLDRKFNFLHHHFHFAFPPPRFFSFLPFSAATFFFLSADDHFFIRYCRRLEKIDEIFLARRKKVAFRHPGKVPPKIWKLEDQGDQIGRIFAQWVIVYVRQFFDNFLQT
jgi:hypothetical protein